MGGIQGGVHPPWEAYREVYTTRVYLRVYTTRVYLRVYNGVP